MSRFLQSLPLSQAGPRRRESSRTPDALIQDLLLMDSAVPPNRIINALDRSLGLEWLKSAGVPRSRAA